MPLRCLLLVVGFGANYAKVSEVLTELVDPGSAATAGGCGWVCGRRGRRVFVSGRWFLVVGAAWDWGLID